MEDSETIDNLIYKLSDMGTFTKDYGLKDQIRRASVSVMSNIAEGFESRTDTRSSIILVMQKVLRAKFVLNCISHWI